MKLLLLAWGNSIGDGRTKNQEVLYANAELLLGDFADFRVPQDRNFSNGYGSSAHTVLTILDSICLLYTSSIDDYLNFSNTAIIILPGGLSWEENNYDKIAEFIRRNKNAGVPVAAICGATTFLCRHGFLNDIKHTGDSLELFQSQCGYSGQALYIPAQVVVDGGFITANETAAVEFAYEIFKILKVDSDVEMAKWYDNFKYGAIR